MAANFLKSRQAKYGAFAGAYIIVIIAVLGAVNWLANRYSKSYDATANKAFTLSDQTIKVAQNLKNDVKIYYFDRSDRFQGAHDLLDRYSALSPKVKVEMIDPDKKKQQAMAAGFRRDVNILVASGEKKEEAKSLTEEEVTGALIRSQKSGERNVCFVKAAGEKSIDDEGAGGFSLMKQLLTRDNYKTKTVDFKSGATDTSKPVAIGQAPAMGAVEVPKDCLALVSGGPQLDYPQPIVDAMKTYVEGGGHALFMLDTPLKIGRDEPAAPNAALLSVLANWGVTANKDLVLDLSGIGSRLGIGPEMPLILDYEQHAIVRPLQRMPTAFRFSRSLDVKSPTTGKAEKLIGTSDESVAVDSIPPGGQIDPRKGKKGPLTLAAAGTTGGSPAGRWVVTGTSQWAENQLMGSRMFANRDLFMNTINWLTADEDLISIRPKSTEDRPLTMAPQKLSLVFWLSVALFPLGIVGLGLATWWKRR
jgi:ABC-type uncharacterized transport system involved in gliding motility auxiliary subunit